MGIKQDTIQDLIDTENNLLDDASELYGEYFQFCLLVHELLSSFLSKVSPDRHLFTIFLSSVRKHYLLSFFSTLRRHHVQSVMDLRQVLEAGGWASYAIQFTDESRFYSEDDGIIDWPLELKNVRNEWLNDNYEDISEWLKKGIMSIGGAEAHSNVVYAMKTFNFDSKTGKFDTPFFDNFDEHQVKGALWWIGNTGFGLLNLFKRVNQDIDPSPLEIIEEFDDKMKEIAQLSEQLKKQLKDESGRRLNS